jgi:hypothetical protein
MAFKRRIPPPTARQQARQDAARELGCVACWMNGRGFVPPEIHHQTDCGFTTSQDATIALCPWHHRAQCRDGWTSAHMTLAYGPSLARGSKPFRERFGSDAEMLAFQNALIAKYRPDLIENPTDEEAAQAAAE